MTILGLLIFMMIVVLGLATFLMNFFSHQERFFPGSVQARINQKNERIEDLRKKIAKLQGEVGQLQKLNAKKTTTIKYVKQKVFSNYDKYKGKDYKFYMADGQVFVGQITKTLKNHVIIYNQTTGKTFKAKKTDILDVLIVKPN